MGIDFETDGFFGEMASMRMDLETYKEWCRAYESFNYPKWTMKDGNEIALGDMSVSHIDNSISMIGKKDPSNGWINIFKQEKKYRSLKDKIATLQLDLGKMEEIMDKVF